MNDTVEILCTDCEDEDVRVPPTTDPSTVVCSDCTMWKGIIAAELEG